VHDNPGGEHERLWSISGEWATDGHVVGDPPLPVKGTDTYEVLAGGYFLVHHVDVTVGDQQVRAIIGEPASEGGAFLARSFDDRGNAEVMRVTVDPEGVFHFTGVPEIACGGASDRRHDRSGAFNSECAARSQVDDGSVGTVTRRRELGAMDEHHIHPQAVTMDSPSPRVEQRHAPGIWCCP